MLLVTEKWLNEEETKEIAQLQASCTQTIEESSDSESSDADSETLDSSEQEGAHCLKTKNQFDLLSDD